jgi:hypothetical protein
MLIAFCDSVRCAVYGVRLSGIRIHAVYDSVWQSTLLCPAVWQCTRQCARQCAAVRQGARQCVAVQRCSSVRHSGSEPIFK